jgi:glucose/arabinose dehydrogenase
VALTSVSFTDAKAQTYRQSNEKNCDGYRSVAVATAPGTCLSLIAQGLGFPRGVLSLSETQVLVADMGSWERGRGRLLLLDISPDGAPARVSVLLSRLDRPHGLAQGPDGRIYLGEATRVSEVRLSGNRASLRPVLVDAPGSKRHPLIGLAVMDDGRIAFSTGSETDACEGSSQAGPCAEAIGPRARAAIRVFTPTETPQSWRDIAPFATGLRNSAALAYDPKASVLWAGENGMDLPSPRLPPDELNKIEAGKDYGWPACFGAGTPAPGFLGARCARTTFPARNLPAHSAPLGMTIIEGGVAGSGRAIAIALHGYMPTGHRVILVPINARGELSGPNREIVYSWNQVRGVQPKGTPVGVTSAPRGGLYITEDGNGTLLRLSLKQPSPAQ